MLFKHENLSLDFSACCIFVGKCVVHIATVCFTVLSNPLLVMTLLNRLLLILYLLFIIYSRTCVCGAADTFYDIFNDNGTRGAGQWLQDIKGDRQWAQGYKSISIYGYKHEVVDDKCSRHTDNLT